MQFRTRTPVWSAAGLLAVAALESIPQMTAPNYRAIVARNQGAVVGITTSGLMNTSSAHEFGFGNPKKRTNVKTGKVVHSRLGVEVQTLNQSLADSFKLKAPNGALVAKVVPDSAAAQTGLKVGDVILKFNGTAIFDAGQLSARVG